MFISLVVFAVSAWRANCGVCPGCRVESLTVRLSDGAQVNARVFLPPGLPDDPQGRGRREGLAAVIIVHGYLANGAFMERPWVKDFGQRGYVAMVLDRRGAGRSDGDLWPQRQPAPRLDDLAPDVRAAIAHLRARLPAIDADRIALFGHSDGATAALMAASADWGVRATVAVSASVGPWEFVNHVAPQDLLLIYGAEDHFVLNDTDRVLIGRSTRGYLDGPGAFGLLADGSARRLLRIPGAGHLRRALR